MDESLVKQAPKLAWKNRIAMEESSLCGCYQCLTVMSTQDIEEWTDYGNTALCPKCGCDCLLPQSSSVPMDEYSLKAIKDHWLS